MTSTWPRRNMGVDPSRFYTSAATQTMKPSGKPPRVGQHLGQRRFEQPTEVPMGARVLLLSALLTGHATLTLAGPQQAQELTPVRKGRPLPRRPIHRNKPGSRVR